MNKLESLKENPCFNKPGSRVYIFICADDSYQSNVSELAQNSVNSPSRELRCTCKSCNVFLWGNRDHQRYVMLFTALWFPFEDTDIVFYWMIFKQIKAKSERKINVQTQGGMKMSWRLLHFPDCKQKLPQMNEFYSSVTLQQGTELLWPPQP